MILHVLDRALAARHISRAIVATDDERIYRVVRAAGREAMLTRADHQSGTDRVAEVAAAIPDAEIIVNVQGDEPLIAAETISLAIGALIDDKHAVMTTTCEKIDNAADVLSPDVVKVVTDEDGNALYFSRSPIPYPRDAVKKHGTLAQALATEGASLLARFRKHTGLYVYRREFLLRYTHWPSAELERTEALEQLRALANGYRIKVIEASTPSIGVDTLEDLTRVRKLVEDVRY